MFFKIGEAVRGSDGFCVFCSAGESGLLVSNINNNDPLKAFDGYANQFVKFD